MLNFSLLFDILDQLFLYRDIFMQQLQPTLQPNNSTVQYFTFLFRLFRRPIHLINRYDQYDRIEQNLIEKINTLLYSQLVIERFVRVDGCDLQEFLVQFLFIVIEAIAHIDEEVSGCWVCLFCITGQLDFFCVLDEGFGEYFEHQCGDFVEHDDHICFNFQYHTYTYNKKSFIQGRKQQKYSKNQKKTINNYHYSSNLILLFSIYQFKFWLAPDKSPAHTCQLIFKNSIVTSSVRITHKQKFYIYQLQQFCKQPKQSMLNQKISQLSNFLIRPKRRSYQQSELGPHSFKTKHGCCIRHDFDVKFTYGKTYISAANYSYPKQSQHQHNVYQQSIYSCQPQTASSSPSPPKTITLKASIFIPTQANFKSNCYSNIHASNQNICLLAMHGNTGSRVSTLSMLQPALKCGLAFANFDFGGCGNSEGEYVTLGYYEKYQIAAVLQQIRYKFGYHKFLLSGRSMGAASCLFYSSSVYPCYIQNKQKSIYHYLHQNQHTGLDILTKLNAGYFGYEVLGIIVDSPYSNTKEMFMDLVGRKLWFCPNIAIDYMLGIVEKKAQDRLAAEGIGQVMGQDEAIVEYKDYEQDQNDRKPIQMNIMIKNQSRIKQQTKKQKIFSICNDITIPAQPLIPFPVYIIYGLQDQVISKKHTLSIFNQIQCKNKKLQILQNAGHGSHRDDQVKIAAICWVLEWQAKKSMTKIEDDARILGMDVQQYMKCWKEDGGVREDYEEIKFEKMEYLYRQKIRQKLSQGQIQTEKTCSMASLKIQTSTSIKSKPYINQLQNNKNIKQQQNYEHEQLKTSIANQIHHKQTNSNHSTHGNTNTNTNSHSSMNVDLLKKCKISVYANLKNQLNYCP